MTARLPTRQTPHSAWVDIEEFSFASALADMDGDMGSFRELGSIYAEELPGQLALLAGSAQSADKLLPVLHEAANTLSVIGARLYARKIRDIEEELRCGRPFDTAAAAQDTGIAMQRSGVALARWLESQPD